jgi:hypothetical protein
MKRIPVILLLFISASLLQITSCDNPFAPSLNKNGGSSGTLSNQETIEGLFENFRYAYIFKDTLVYGDVLESDFVFIYRNYEKGTDESWGREQEMLTSYRLFQATQNLDLVWNEILVNVGDSLLRDVSRSFNLNIVFNPSDIIRINGIANFRLKRNQTDRKWRILSWRDESNF